MPRRKRQSNNSTYWIILALVTLAFGWVMKPVWLPIFSQQQTEAKTKDKDIIHQATDEVLLAEWQEDIHPMLEHYCYDCHGDGSSKGKLDLEAYPDIASMRANPKVWEHILARVNYHLMPPPKEEQPTTDERQKISAWINQAVFPIDPDDPGQSAIRRLNRTEYRNTLRDLLGVRLDVEQLLPPDDSGYGFDNIGSVLSISPAHIEKYLGAAELAVDQSMREQPIIFNPLKVRSNGRNSDQGIFLFKKGSAHINPRTKTAGKYRLHISASAQQAGDEPAKMQVYHRTKMLREFNVDAQLGNQKTFTTELTLKRGFNDVRATFANDFYDANHPDPRKRDRNLMIHSIRLEGPIDSADGKSSAFAKFFPKRKTGNDKTYAHEVIGNFISKAFRRPPNNSEHERYTQLALRLAKQQQSLEEGILGAFQAILVSPSFLYIAPPTHSGDIQPVDEYTLASRLSYFLWSSMPDDKLLELASNNQLRENLDQQINRMLADDRSSQLSKNFAGQWLQLRDLSVIQPDGKTFRAFTPDIRRDMQKETQMMVDYILLGNRNLLELINGNYSFLNSRLAAFYQIPNVTNKNHEKVILADPRRRGILTHGAILTLTSTPVRTSPVLRGKYVLENILDITPPPPPPNLPDLEDQKNHAKLSMREQLAVHRKKSACAGCHNLMDPVGLAFEHFDAIGRWRKYDKGKLIDSSGKLVTGEEVKDATSLIATISTGKKDEFLRCIIRKMLTYSLGRGVTHRDRHTVENILCDLRENDYSSYSLISSIIHSRPFQYQK